MSAEADVVYIPPTRTIKVPCLSGRSKGGQNERRGYLNFSSQLEAKEGTNSEDF